LGIKELSRVERVFKEVGAEVLWGRDNYTTSAPDWDIYNGE
jgi:hypothetical protein